MDRKWILEMKKLLLLLFNYKSDLHSDRGGSKPVPRRGENSSRLCERWFGQLKFLLSFIEIVCNDS